MKERMTPIDYVSGDQISVEAVTKMTKLRTQFKQLYLAVHDSLPPGRARSLALTEIESACHWTVKSLAFKDVELTDGFNV
jgi:hypothetical protein